MNVMNKKILSTSETKIIKRSQINLNPINPKDHTDDGIKKQLRNFKKVGYLGGIVWNETTGNLVDGHKRILAQDIYYNYGDAGVDYDVKVEVCSLDKKQEMEQLTYMSMANTKADMQLIAKYIDDIDFENAGLTEQEYKAIMDFNPADDIPVDTITLDDLVINNTVFERPKTQYEQTVDPEERARRIEEIKEIKHSDNNKTFDSNDTTLMISFSTMDDKQVFLDFFGIYQNERVVSGDQFLDLLEAKGYI